MLRRAAEDTDATPARAEERRRSPWRLTALVLSGLTVSALAARATAAHAEPPPTAPSGTNLHSSDGGAAASSVLSFGCSYSSEGEPPRVNYTKLICRIATTGITRPGPEQVQQRLQELDAPEPVGATPGAPPPPHSFAGACADLTTPRGRAELANAAGAQRAYYERLSKACAARDPLLGKEALRFGITEVWAKTCEIFNYGTREYEFNKVDDASWRSIDEPPAGGGATIRTIWRKKAGGKFTAWNYKQVTSADPSCVGAPFRECPKDATLEWTNDARPTLTGCLYFN